jgi:filamentous hemagglutinin
MNKRAFRLVFDRQRGMRVPASESTRSAGKAASGGTRATRVATAAALVVAALGSAMAPEAQAGNLRSAVLTASRAGNASTVTLPVKSTNAARPWVSKDLENKVGWDVDGKVLTIDQRELVKLIMNFDSFNIGPGYAVNVRQSTDTDKPVSAMFKIWSSDPSLIFGTLTANRELILQNANGVLFGRGARVDTGSLVATALSIADSTFQNGIRNTKDGSAVFTADGDDFQKTNLDAVVSVEPGAIIRAAAGGDVMLVAPRVLNQGSIEVKGGQAILAAGRKVYLASSGSSSQRGMIVAVDPYMTTVNGAPLLDAQGMPLLDADGKPTFEQVPVPDPELGIVENAAKGDAFWVNATGQEVQAPASAAEAAANGLVQKINQIKAETGSVNLVGLLVKQNGVIRATTAVKGLNGSILLQGQASTANIKSSILADQSNLAIAFSDVSNVSIAAQQGTVAIGAGSLTSVTPEDSAATQLSSEEFNRSLVRVEGKTISVGTNATVEAAGGDIQMLAAATKWSSGNLNGLFAKSANNVSVTEDGSRLIIGQGVTLNVGGLKDVAVEGSRYQRDTRLFRIELADSPVQRGGVLYRQQVLFDARGASGIDIANISNVAAATPMTAREMTTAGGTLLLDSADALFVADTATLDISGGSVKVSTANNVTSALKLGDRLVSLDAARKDVVYDGVVTPTLGRQTPAYIQGAAGGRAYLNAARMVMQGQVKGQTVKGTYQRGGAVALPDSAKLFIGRGIQTLSSFDATKTETETTSDGLLPRLQVVNLVPQDDGQYAPGGDLRKNVDALLSNPLESDTGFLSRSFDLSLAAVQQYGVGKLEVLAQQITQNPRGDLTLPAKGSLTLRAYDIGLNGNITAPGGSITAITTPRDGSILSPNGQITLANNSHLSTAGLFTNDHNPSDPATIVQTRGGSITLNAFRGLSLGTGTSLDVSAGVWLPYKGSNVLGKAGSITLSSVFGYASKTPDVPVAPDSPLALNNATLLGRDFSTGGSLTLSVPSYTIAKDAASAAGQGLTGFVLMQDFFSHGGFGNITVNALGDVRVKSDVVLTPTLENLVLERKSPTLDGGAMSEQVAKPTMLDERYVNRQPVNLTLAATAALQYGEGASTFKGSNLSVERGAQIILEEGSALAMSATGSLLLGTDYDQNTKESSTVLRALGGSVQLTVNGTRGEVTPENDKIGFFTDQALWVSDKTTIDVSGTYESRTSNATKSRSRAYESTLDQAGNVFGGGTISLTANRGYVVLEKGSKLKLDGKTENVQRPGSRSAVTVSKDAGKLSISTPEGLVIEGSASAQGAGGSNGGTLKIDLAGGAQLNFGTSGPTTYGTGARTLLIGASGKELSQTGTQAGGDLLAALGNGVGYLSMGTLTTSGFATLDLNARDKIVFDPTLQPKSADKTHTVIDMALNAPMGLGLHSATLEVQNLSGYTTQVKLSGTHASLGQASTTQLDTVTDANLGPNSLSVSAQTIDWQGKSSLQGLTSTTLNANEVRWTGQGNKLVGSLAFAGALNLNAGQTYATDSSSFTLQGVGLGNKITVADGNAALKGPLSIFGQLSMKATDIDQLGVIRQPFGIIELQAENRLTMGAYSLTSVSGDGLLLPGGQLLNQNEWRQTLGLGVSLLALPREKRITLSGAEVVYQVAQDAQTGQTHKATIDAHAGGDIQTREFFPGVGGSSDYLATSGLYAVLPDYADQTTLNTGELSDKQLIITTPGGALPPGRYTLLPATYALLAKGLPQGAFVVSLASDQGNKAALPTAFKQTDGSELVTGAMVSAGGTASGLVQQRFMVEPEATFRAKSEYRTTSVTEFLGKRSTQLGVPAALAPVDAGQIQLSYNGTSSSTELKPGSLDANILLAGNTSGRAGFLDISAKSLTLVDALPATLDSQFYVNAASLGESGAASIMLGGFRTLVQPTATEPALLMQVSTSRGANSVTLANASQPLKVQELLVSASQSLTVNDKVNIEASGQTTLPASRLELTGDGALVALSNNLNLDVTRTGVTATTTNTAPTGTLSVLGTASLTGRSVQIDAALEHQLSANATIQGERFGIAAPRLSVGGAGPQASTVLQGALLNAAKKAQSLTLRSYSSIDFVGQQKWAEEGVLFKNLTLDASSIGGHANGAELASAHLGAQEVLIRNSAGNAPEALTGRSGTLVIDASPVTSWGHTGGITKGINQTLLNFGTATLNSTGDIILGAGASGSKLLASGALSLNAGRLTAQIGADQSIEATGALRIGLMEGASTLGEHVGHGAKVNLQGSTVTQDGVVDLASGQLSFNATNTDVTAESIVFGENSRTSVAGFHVDAQNDWRIYGDGGSVNVKTAGIVSFKGQTSLTNPALSTGATLDVGADEQGNAGTLSIRAAKLKLNGVASVQGHAGQASTDLGGRLLVDVNSTTDAATLNDLAKVSTDGGFSREVDLRMREGNQSLNQSIQAKRITLSADGGTLAVNSTLDARASSGGVVQLFARDTLSLGASAQVLAGVTGAPLGHEYQGGDILLSSSTGTIDLDAALADKAIDAGREGRIKLRALLNKADIVTNTKGTATTTTVGSLVAVNNGLKAAKFKSGQLNASEVILEGVNLYNWKSTTTTAANVTTEVTDPTKIDHTLTSTVINQINTGNTAGTGSAGGTVNTLKNAASVYSALGVTDLSKVRLDAGVEVRSSGNLSLGTASTAADWNLAAVPSPSDNTLDAATKALAGTLTLRAAGNLNINSHINDGYTTATGTVLNARSNAWSIRLIGGADNTSANVMATRDLSNAATALGNLNVANAKVIRTGAASIEMATGQNMNLGTANIYVVGRKAPLSGDAGTAVMTTGGRQLELKARGSIAAATPTQMQSWMQSQGKTNVAGTQYEAGSGYLAWWSRITDFKQGLANFGGGNILVDAGINLSNISVSSPTQGHAKSVNVADGVDVDNGGDITVRAGQNILGGYYLLGRGIGQIEAGGDFDVGVAGSIAGKDQHAISLMDGTWNIQARGKVDTYTPYNATMAGSSALTRDFYFTYSDTSAVNIKSLSGNVTLKNNFAQLATTALGVSNNLGNDVSYQVMPGIVSVLALGGDLAFNTTTTNYLYASPTGSLKLYAQDDLALSNLVMLDSATSMPTALKPASSALAKAELSKVIRDALPLNVNNTALHALDTEPVRLAAGGDLSGVATSSGTVQASSLTVPKAAKITAGGDISDFGFYGQHHQGNDSTLIKTGGNFIQTSAANGSQIVLNGPGTLNIQVGRQFDLGDSLGVSTTGNLNNPTLPGKGASVNISASLSSTLNVDAFAQTYLSASNNPRALTHQRELVDFVRDALKLPALKEGDDLNAAYAQALSQFRAFPKEAQRQFGQSVLAQEFGATYLSAGSAPNSASMLAELQASFDRYKAVQLSQLAQLAGDLAQASGISDAKAREARIDAILEAVPVALNNEAKSRELLAQDRSIANINKYLAEVQTFSAKLNKLTFSDLNVGAAVATRVADRQASAQGWANAVAQSLGSTVGAVEALMARTKLSEAEQKLVTQYKQGLNTFSGELFERYKQEVVLRETRSATQAVSGFAVNTWPMLPALYNEGYKAQELAGMGTYRPNSWWPGADAAFNFIGNINLTGSTVRTQLGGDINLFAPGGELNVGLKEGGKGDGIIAQRGGNVNAIMRDDLQVNTERIFSLADVTDTAYSMILWSGLQNLDSGRGSNTAVASEKLVARRGPQGVVFETPPPTSGSGIGILDGLAKANAQSTVWLAAPMGEVLALDAFIRAPVIPPSPSPIKGGDNVMAAGGGSDAKAVVVPVLNITPPNAGSDKLAQDEEKTRAKDKEAKAQSLMTVDLLGLGEGGSSPAAGDATEGANNTSASGDGQDEKKKKKKSP